MINLSTSDSDSFWSSDGFSFLLFTTFRCDDKAFKKLLSNFGSSRSEESCSAVVELLERVTRLHKQLELKESQAEIDMDQVQTTADLHHTRVGYGGQHPLFTALSGHALLCFIPSVISWLFMWHLTRLERTGKGCYESGGLQRQNHSKRQDPAASI